MVPTPHQLPSPVAHPLTTDQVCVSLMSLLYVALSKYHKVFGDSVRGPRRFLASERGEDRSGVVDEKREVRVGVLNDS